MIRVSDYIISKLYSLNTKYIFLLTGGGAMYLNDAVVSQSKMKYVCNHHEQACAMAAEIYSRVTGNLGVAMVTSGPGGTNAVTGVLGAWQDSTPCLFISGQAKRNQTVYNSGIENLRQMGTQEVNIIPIIKSITKFSTIINNPELIRYELEKAIYMAYEGRPGPVWLDIPLDVQSAMIDPTKLIAFNPLKLFSRDKKTSTDKEIDEIIKLLQVSKKPLLIAGNGIKLSKAKSEFLKLVKTLKIPVVTTVLGLDILHYNHPLNIGRGGTKGNRSANIAIQNADLIISIGSRLAVPFIGYEYDLFAPKAKIVVVDIDPNEHKKKTIIINKVIISDAKAFICKLNSFLKNKHFSFMKGWTQKLKRIQNKYPIILPEYSKLPGKMNMYYVMDVISNALDKNDIIISDAGSAFYVVSQAIKTKQGQQVILPGGTATMGFNLPASIGASIGTKNKRVICITGDGSLHTNIHELETIRLNKLPIKIFVFNNNGYLSIRNTQGNLLDNRLIGEGNKTGVTIPNLKLIAKAYSIKYYQVKNSKELLKVVPLTLKYKGPVLCDISCLEKQPIIPTVSSKKLPDGSMKSTSIDDMYPFLSTKEMIQIKKDLK